MSERATMVIEKREKTNSRASKQLRKIGYVPGSISRKGKESISVKVKQEELLRNLSKYGRNYIFNLQMDGDENIAALVKEMDYSPIKRDLLSVNFQEISFTEEIKVNLGIKLNGRESVEFRKLLVIQHINEIPVKGLPQNIPDFIEVDITDLDVDDKITIGDVKFPEGIEPEIEADKIILTINKPKMRGLDAAAESEGEEDAQAEAETEAETE